MLVGEPAAGKTTLVRRLKGEVCSHKLSQTNISTDGIDLGEVVLHGIRFMCWDFGGQEVSLYLYGVVQKDLVTNSLFFYFLKLFRFIDTHTNFFLVIILYVWFYLILGHP